MTSEIEKLKEIIEQQGERISSLSQRLSNLENTVSGTTYHEPGKEMVKEPEKEMDVSVESDRSSVEKPTDLFKIFGIVGSLMIILGAVFFYKYAVDNGWIGITGRVAVGIILSFIFISLGLALFKREYVHFSQLIIGSGLGLMYYTFFSTYHFMHFREALGMTLTLNTLLLLIVMLGGMFIGFRLDTRYIVYISMSLGFLAAFLSGITGKTLHILIYILLIDIIVIFIAKFRSWYEGIPALILTYIAFSIWFVQGIYDPGSILNQTTMPVILTFTFLLGYYGLFTLLTFIQASKGRENECLVISLVNTITLSGFGLGIINRYFSEFNGMYLMLVAALTLFVGYLLKQRRFEKLFEEYFMYTVILVALAIPVQFDNSIVTVLWVLMALGLAYAGLSINNERLFNVGYYGFIIPSVRILLYDMFFLETDVERWIAVGSGLLGIWVLQLFLHQLRAKSITKIEVNFNYPVFGIFLSVVWIAREIYSMNMSLGGQHVLVSIAWASISIIVIMYGVINKNKVFNQSGVILFGFVVIKVLMIDISSMPNILRVAVLTIVGVLALLGSFVFVKNMDKFKEFI